MAKQQKEVERWITVNGARVPIFKGESKVEVKERIYRKNAGKHETKIRNMDDNWSRKLSRGEKEAMRMEVEKERREAGNPVKSSYGKTYSKLHQHSEIQKMADEHVRKIWTKEGGVANKELYDEADKFAEKNNLDKKKVRDAAFKAMNEKYADSLKLKKEGKDPLQNIKKESKQSKQINKDFDTKEKQIKQNEAERDKLNGKSSNIDLSEYKYIANQNGYQTYRKIENGKGVWVAQDQDKKNPPFKISYEQALGQEPIIVTNAEKLSKQVGDALFGKKSKTIKETHDSQLIKNAKAGNISNPSKLFMPELKTLAKEFGIDPTGKSKEELANIIGSILKKRK